MDWDNEPWVKLYTRDTGDRLEAGWEANAVFDSMLRKCSRSGIIDARSARGLSASLRIPADVVERAVVILQELNMVQVTEMGYLLPSFLKAQEARTSNAQRQRDFREKERANALSKPSKKVSASIQGRNDTLLIVTRGNAESRAVTNRLDEMRLDDHVALRATVVSHLNLRVGSKYSAEAKPTVKLLDKLAKDYSAEQIVQVIDAKVAEWTGGEMAKYLRPSTLFGSKFPTYHTELTEGGTRLKLATGQSQYKTLFGEGS